MGAIGLLILRDLRRAWIGGLARRAPNLDHRSVRVERSRDTHRPCATPMGVSTSLDTNGIGTMPI